MHRPVPNQLGKQRILIAAAIVIASAASGTAAPPRGYSIPTIDLAQEKQRQVVVDREKGQYLGHPTTVLLEDNKTLIAVYPKGHGRGAIVMRRSSDGGKTWSSRLPVPENWATSKEVPTIYRVVDAKGVKRLIMFSGLHPIRMAVSDDDGETWSPLASIGKFGGIVAMADLVRLSDGRYMALFHDDGRFFAEQPAKSRKFHVYKTLSSDGGLTWSKPEVIATHATAHLCEPGAVRSPDGKQLAVLLRENSRKHNSFIIFSGDEGQTWSDPVELPGALTGDRHQCRYAPDGRLVISFRDQTHVSPTKGDWVMWVGRYEDLVQGREGQYRVRLMDNHRGADCAYPAIELLPDGTFVATTYGHWTQGESPYIVSVRFKLDEIDARAKQSTVRVIRDVAYLGADREEKLDLYLPADAKAGDRFPAVVIIHGGGFTKGDKGAARERNIGTNLALNGYVGASINYKLAAPGKPCWPQNLHDCKTAVRFLRHHAEQYHIDAGHIGAIGGSAGGHLTAMLALAGPEAKLEPEGPYGEFSSRVQAFVPLYGAHDFLKRGKDLSMLPATIRENPDLYRVASPVTHVDSDDPPALILHGTADKLVPVEQSERLAEVLKQHGVEHQLVIVEGAPHSFHLQPKQRDLRPLVLGFFDEHLK